MNQTQAQATASTSLSTPAGSTPRLASSLENATISLSPSAVDALQLAQFLKNLGVSVLKTSKMYTRRSTEANYGASSLVADISEMQLEALKTLLRRSGGEHVPPCQYSAPGNATELVTLMAVLKTIELGVFMSLTESLPPTHTPATILLSSIASAAAKQNALLHTHTVSNASIESFETPSSAAWAYNLALGYVQPGSCAVELPLPILPTLTMNDRTVGYARPGTEVTFSWDAAGVNQLDVPVYTSLAALGDGSGTTRVPLGLSGTAFAVLTAQPELTSIDELTAATLAGPVVVSLTL
ncbi:late sexual development protein [Paraphaeosphaeria minitans]|uniref:Late sexual development protein n=1 Tax=Paraphaeosphaeria minitans TaxID=565426 RepID=A0A9P6G615_9PLEO|nr:late sexual development protein [Paraphaeosphaeria minitans]